MRGVQEETQLLGRSIVMKGIVPRTTFLGSYNAESMKLFNTFFKTNQLFTAASTKSPHPVYPFTAPAVKPLIKFFDIVRYSTKTGIADKVSTAKIRDQSVIYCPNKRVTPSSNVLCAS